MTRRTSTLLWLAAVVVASALPLAASARGLMEGKIKTDRTVVVEATVDASPSDVYRMWTTPEGVQRFFAPAARIDARRGGRYEILFAPDRDPEGLSHGTTGARMLALVPGREIAFEWITFAGDSTLGRNAPPVAPSTLRNMRPLPTWVDVRLAPVAGDPGRTRVTLRHYGFRHGELWDGSYAFFGKAWAGVLAGLETACRRTGPVTGAEATRAR